MHKAFQPIKIKPYHCHCQSTTAPAHASSLVSDHTRASHAHARPLHPAALAFVPYGLVLVRVRVRVRVAVAQPPRGSTTSTSHQHPLIRAPCTTAPAHTSPLVSDHTRASHAHARPLHPAALAFVPYGIILVRVRVPKCIIHVSGKPSHTCEYIFRCRSGASLWAARFSESRSRSLAFPAL